MYRNDRLELIGATSCPSLQPHSLSLTLLFYLLPVPFHAQHPCSFSIESLYDDYSSQDLQTLLNTKQNEEQAFYRACLPVYESSQISRERGVTSHQKQLYCSFFIFQHRTPDLEDQDRGPYMLTKGIDEMEEQPEKEVVRFVYEQELLQKFKFCAFLPKHSF